MFCHPAGYGLTLISDQSDQENFERLEVFVIYFLSFSVPFPFLFSELQSVSYIYFFIGFIFESAEMLNKRDNVLK